MTTTGRDVPRNKKTRQGLFGTDPLMQAAETRDGSVLQMVKQALAHNEIRLAVQPVVSTRNSDQVAFYEGLIRVLDDTGRVIPAREFMPQVAESELGREIDVKALWLGCRLLHQQSRLRVSINMSARSIGYQPWLKTLNRWLKKDDSIGPRLILEISENSAIQVPELLIDFMERLQPAGVCFALDDFGAGQTALRHFRDFFFDMVKIDGQFIKGISQNPDNQVLVEALRGVAQQFDMLTIAAMVESGADAKFVTAMGIDCGQGYYYGAPTTRPPWSSGTVHQLSA